MMVKKIETCSLNNIINKLINLFLFGISILLYSNKTFLCDGTKSFISYKKQDVLNKNIKELC